MDFIFKETQQSPNISSDTLRLNDDLLIKKIHPVRFHFWKPCVKSLFKTHEYVELKNSVRDSFLCHLFDGANKKKILA